MANPKRRHSHSRTRLRRSHDGLKKTQSGVCPKCDEPALPHRVCNYCGSYRGSVVVNLEPEAAPANPERKK
jgi:large subunit ribosomal protein L32